VGRALGGVGRTLLVLEGVDGVRDHLAPALARWLSDAPHALFGITARAPIEVPTERVVPLLGLELAELSATRLGELTPSPAAQLFLRRVIPFNRRILSDDSLAAPINAICHACGGHPFSLELIAGCAETMPLGAIADSLGSTLVNLGGTAIIQPERSAAGAAAWRCAQLPQVERAVLMQCAIFRGGFGMQAAEAVVELPAAAEGSVADVVQRLERLGLLRREPGGHGDDRYSMHPLIKAACAPELYEGLPEVRARHARYYAQLGSDEAMEALRSRGGSMRRARYDLELDNLHSALEHATASGDAETMAACALATGSVLAAHGRAASAARQLVHGVANASVSDLARLRCLLAQGEALLGSRRPDAAEEVLELAADSAHALGQDARLATALRARARLFTMRGQAEAAATTLDQAMQLSARHGDRLGRAEGLRAQAELFAVTGALEAARAHLSEAARAFHELSARQLEAEALGRLGLVALERGDTAEGRARIEASLVLHRELGNRHAEAELLGRLGEWTGEQGDAENARALLEHASGRCRELGACDLEGRYLASLAAFKPSANFERAFFLMQQGEQLVRGEGGGEQLVIVLCRRAQLELASGRRDLAYGTQREMEARRAQLDVAAARRVQPAVERLQRLLSGV
jgi:tetratricopeptide (TPR) repeat protein